MRQDLRDNSAGAPVRLLIVEDDQAIRLALVELLSGEGYEVEEATNGAVALAKLRRGPPPALILLDLMMPVMSGWEFMRQLKAEPQLRALPVVVLSASPPSTLPEGIVAYLRKPVDLELLLSTLAEHSAPRLLAAGSR
jgi:two-component system, OmpR family, response regulator CpxR